MKNKIIMVQDIQVTVSYDDLNDYICISDMAKAKSGESRAADVIKNWLRNRVTLEFLVLGNRFIILSLKWSNSTTLNWRRDCILSL